MFGVAIGVADGWWRCFSAQYTERISSADSDTRYDTRKLMSEEKLTPEEANLRTIATALKGMLESDGWPIARARLTETILTLQNAFNIEDNTAEMMLSLNLGCLSGSDRISGGRQATTESVCGMTSRTGVVEEATFSDFLTVKNQTPQATDDTTNAAETISRFLFTENTLQIP